MRPRFLLIPLPLILLLAACAAATPAPTEVPAAEEEPEPTAEPTEVMVEETEEPEEPAMQELTEPEPVPDLPTVSPVLETRQILDLDAEDAPEGATLGDPDDPAIWLHPDDPAQSVIAVVLKEGGLEVYDLEGNPLQEIAYEGGRFNNIDLIYNFPLGGQPTDIFVVTDRYKDLMLFFAIDPQTRELTDVTDPANPLVFTPEGEESDEETTAYGVAAFQSVADGAFYAFVNRRDTGELTQLLLTDSGSGLITWEKVREFELPIPEGGEEDDAQTEGMVVDPGLGFVYIGQENVGIWKLGSEPGDGTEAELIYAVRPDGEYLEADVEGLTIYFGPDGTGYLVVSSQGDNTFAVFAREGENEYIGSFQIGPEGDIDGVQECDGAMVMNIALGEMFPSGLLVVQDGFDAPLVSQEDEGELESVSGNFKFVPWENVANVFETPLLIDTESYNPRTPAQ